METADPGGHAFDAATALTQTDAGAWIGHTNPAYANMVGPFGGVIGATLLNAVLSHPQRSGTPILLTVNYAAPVSDGAFVVEPRIVRSDDTTQHWIVELRQSEGVAAFATVVTAARRETWNATDIPFPPGLPRPQDVPVASSHPRAAWTDCYEMRFIEGMPSGVPADEGHPPSQTTLWVRDKPPRPLDFLSLFAICDVFFPRIFLHRPTWVPVGTVTLTTHFYADDAQLDDQGTLPLLGVARALQIGKGFFDQTAEVWSSNAVLLATTRQVVYFKGEG